MNRMYAAAVFTAAFACGTAFAGAGFWSSTGPYGGDVYDVTSEPGDASVMYVLSRGGLYRSMDGGDSWQSADSGLGDQRVAAGGIVVDAERPQDVYTFALLGGLHRSTDRASNWVATGFELPSLVQPVALVDVPGSMGELMLLVRDVRAPGSAQVPLLRSIDAGATFAPFGAGLPAGGSAVAMAIDPTNSAHRLLVFLATEGNLPAEQPYPPTVYRSTDSGANWSAVYTHPGTTVFLPFNQGSRIAYGGGDRVYALSLQRVLRSDNRGATWIETSFSEGSANDLVAHPATADRLFIATRDAIWESLDGGNTATRRDDGLTPNGSYLSSIDSAPIGAQMQRLHADPGFPGLGTHLWAATVGAGLARSADLGGNWFTSHVGLAASQIRAIAVDPNPGSIATGPFAGASRVYAGFGDAFLSSPAAYRLNTTTLQWEPRNLGLRASQIRALAVDPTTARAGDPIAGAHIYGSGGGALEPGFLNAGLFKSTDSGSTWTTIDATLPSEDLFSMGVASTYLGTVRAIALDPRSCDAEPRLPSPSCVDLPPPGGADPAIAPLKRVYAAASGFPDFDSVSGETVHTHRLLRSDDAGATWTDIGANPGFPESHNFFVVNGASETLRVTGTIVPLPIAISPDDPDRLYVGTFTSFSCRNQTLGTDCTDADRLAHTDVPTGVFRSNDRGLTWTAASNGLPRLSGGYTNAVQEILSMVMHPTDHDVLWASIVELSTDPALRAPPIWKSTNGGASWIASATGIPQGTDVRALAVDPGDGNLLYAAGAGTSADPGSVYRSSDGGATWTSVSIGLPADSALALAVDPHNASVLHAGTNTGAWSIEQLPDADGDGSPDAVESFAPNGGDGNGDGEVDALQGDVGSTIVLFGAASAKDLAALPKGAGGYQTVEIISGTGACAQAVDVQTKLASRYGRDFLDGRTDYHLYPRDLSQFEIMDCDAAVVDVIFHGADFDSTYGWTLRYYGPSVPGDAETIGWHDFSERAERVAPDRWRLTLDANEFGSYRPVQDRILFIGGPACYDDRVFTSDFEDVSRALPACG